MFSPSTDKKASYLKALSHLVSSLPKEVQLSELPAVSRTDADILISHFTGHACDDRSVDQAH